MDENERSKFSKKQTRTRHNPTRWDIRRCYQAGGLSRPTRSCHEIIGLHAYRVCHWDEEIRGTMWNFEHARVRAEFSSAYSGQKSAELK